ncbi:hypothetical protein XM48_07665 [Leucobacter sp. Ag1]|nr:hypothetical protein XM48_07665 [Leucobacter sp. Ag1]
MRTAIKDFLERSTGASVREMARAADLNHTRVGRQLNGDSELSASVVVAIARAFGIDVLDALVAGGFITADEASRSGARGALHAATDFELAREIMNRAAQGSAGSVLTEPLDADALAAAGPKPDRHLKIVMGVGDDAKIPENVEDEWEGRYAAHPNEDWPEDHTP